MSDAIPAECQIHGIALFPTREDVVKPFLAYLQSRFSEFDGEQRGWNAIGEPRSYIYGPLSAGDWRWHMLYDLGGLPANLRETFDHCRMTESAASVIADHQAAVQLFALRAPANTKPLDRVRVFAELMWQWIAMGADVLAFPTGHKAWHREQVASFDPLGMTAEDFGMFVDYGYAGPPVDGRQWLRTYGMQHFDIPDLVCSVPDDDSAREQIELALPLFHHLPAYLIERNELLPVGDWINLEDEVWDVAGWSDKQTQPFLSNTYGRLASQCFVRRGAL